jgi:beta-mannosidase
MNFQTISQPINQGWMFQQESSSNWMDAVVPGCVHLDLLNHNLIPEPFFGLNEKEIQWISNQGWVYRLIFDTEKEIYKKKNKRLCFNGLDTYANIYLNGEKIISADNMFHPWEADVSTILLPEKNELIVVFRSPLKEIAPKMQSLGHSLPAENDQAGKTSPFTRKAPFHYGWDWGPCFVTLGIWKEVELVGWNQWHIEKVSIVTNKLTETSADLEVEIKLMSESDEECQVAISEPRSGIVEKFESNLVTGKNIFKYLLSIRDPELWWPVGHGEQPLYTFKIVISSNMFKQECTKRIGIRDVLIKREKGGKGESFEIHVNNQPIFSKGANWIPADSFTTRLTYKDYERLLGDAVKANMNTLRVWGGGIYEPDHFYDICDELGILVWQDFMFACSMYPADDMFLNSVKKEAEYQVNRLKHHPSIILWCGNNEIASGWLSWGWKEELPASVWDDYKKLFHELLPDVCEKVDPSRLYWPSSPGHDLAQPEIDQVYGSGDNHYWGVWHGGDDFDAFENNIGRFISEYGMQSFPEVGTIEKFSRKKDLSLTSKVFEGHQKASLGNGNVLKYIDEYYTRPKDFSRTVSLSQIMQAKAIRAAVEVHRRNMPFCMGTLYWQLNDCWPGPSWSSIDYYGNWKALHYAAKKFYAPVLVSITEKNGQVEVHIVNDQGHSISGKLITTLFLFNGTKIKEISEHLDIDPYSSSKKLSLDKEKLMEGNNEAEIVLKGILEINKISIAESEYYFSRPKDLKLNKPEFSVNYEFINERHFIYIKAKSHMHEVHLNCLNRRGLFSDNYFNLLPNEIKEIEFIPDETTIESKGALRFQIKSLYELMYE